MNLENFLIWYQQRIGLYDKQSWETTVEQRILRGLSYSPRKTAKQKTDLIDVDLVRGSTFPKAKPKSDVWMAGLYGVIRILLLPFYVKWWIKETTHIGLILVISMYCSVMLSSTIYLYFYETVELKIVPGFEVFLPFAILLLLSIILSQMASTRRKGIKLAFRESKFGRNIRGVRKPRSSRRNSTVSGGLNCTFGSSDIDVKNTSYGDSKNYKNLDSFHRSHSEELHLGPTMDFDNRSASESNLLLKCVDDQKQGENGIDGSTTTDSTVNVSFVDNKVGKTKENTPSLFTNDCHVRYRGYKDKIDSKKDVPDDTTVNYSSTNGIPKITKYRFERYSDNCSDDNEEGCHGDYDHEEGCHADCESPFTDEDERSIREKKTKFKLAPNLLLHRRSLSPQSLNPLPKPDLNYSKVAQADDDVSISSCDSDVGKSAPSFSASGARHKPMFGDWVGVTTNSEDPSYSSESEGGWGDDITESGQGMLHREPIDWHIQGAPAAVISSTTKEVDKGEKSSLSYLISPCIGCKIWEDSEMKKVDLSVLDISSAIISRVDSLHQSSNYLRFGIVMSVFLSFVPTLFRVVMVEGGNLNDTQSPSPDQSNPMSNQLDFLSQILGDNYWCWLLITLNGVNRLVLGSCFFFLLSVAERTFKQRFLYAKHFCYLTSARRARKYDLPHFRLNKVINIKSWLSIRSCLKKRGPQHSVDVIISATFIVTLLLVSYLGVEALKDEEKVSQPLHNCELFAWCFAVSIYLIRFMTLGALINKKYSNPSVLITEQINMYLHMEQNPQKKDNLMLANNVLKLVSVLLKELDSPFKISGLSANTLLYNITKFGILSACSGVLSNLLGFKLKLHHIKFK
ncbi:UNVERIFIED_CONTAM: hypothetical protein RMT77_000729 [Armadillidium vulgare]